MYEELNCFEEALNILVLELKSSCYGTIKRVSSEDAYQMIKEELKEVKNVVNSLRKMSANISGGYKDWEDFGIP